MSWDKNQNAWVELFKTRAIERDLEETGFHRITAEEISHYREPRLMTKFDYSEALPTVLREADCAPISVSRSAYVLVRPYGSLFTQLGDIKSPPIAIPNHEWQEKIFTLPWGEVLTSESQAIDQAFLLPIFKSFFEERELWATIRGRSTLKNEVPIHMRLADSSIFRLPFNADGVQVEFDGGFESTSSIYLVEAKIKIPSDINLRQFYFPYWYWTQNLEAKGKRKPIRLIFLAYSAHSYYLYELKFSDPGIINSLEIVKTAHYIVGELEFSWQQLKEVLAKAPEVKTITDIPFPQADEFERVLNIVELAKLSEEETTPSDLSENYQFTLRQSDYYANAAYWLGWLEPVEGGWKVTSEGKNLVSSKSLSEMALKICGTLAERPVTSGGLAILLKEKNLPEKEKLIGEINTALSHYKIKAIGGETIPRRAQTVRSWLAYLLNIIKED